MRFWRQWQRARLIQVCAYVPLAEGYQSRIFGTHEKIGQPMVWARYNARAKQAKRFELTGRHVQSEAIKFALFDGCYLQDATGILIVISGFDGTIFLSLMLPTRISVSSLRHLCESGTNRRHGQDEIVEPSRMIDHGQLSRHAG